MLNKLNSIDMKLNSVEKKVDTPREELKEHGKECSKIEPFFFSTIYFIMQLHFRNANIRFAGSIIYWSHYYDYPFHNTIFSSNLCSIGYSISCMWKQQLSRHDQKDAAKDPNKRIC